MSEAFTSDFIEFLNESCTGKDTSIFIREYNYHFQLLLIVCTAFHAVEASKKRLVANDFIELYEKDDWVALNLIKNGGKYFFIRNQATIIAFSGDNYFRSMYPFV